MEKIKAIIILAILLSSCSSKKNILYLQNLEPSNSYVANYEEYKISVDDILRIEINSGTPELLSSLNPNMLQNNSQNKESLLFEGYQVDSDGNIFYPMIGKLYVHGMTLIEIRKILYDTIIKLKLLKDPHIDVKIINSYFSILGEVNRPGKYEYLKNNINILEAISMAGDLTINGERKHIKIIRENLGKNKVYSVDLTDSNILNKNFQIFSGDIIIINPNSSRIKNAGIIGNSGTLLSLLTFILSSIIVISNN